MSSKPFFGLADRAGAHDAEQRSRRANRRRLTVFLSVFVTLAVIGLIYDFARPAIYRTSAQLDFVPASARPAAAAATSPTAGTPSADAADRPYSLRDEVQYLSSTTLLSKVWSDIDPGADVPPSLRTANPPATLQSMLSVTQIPNTNIVAIEATGGDPAFLPRFVDRLIADYQASLGERFRSGSATALAEAADEATKLDAAVKDKRTEVDAYRARNNIVSVERDENQVLSEVKGVGTALNTANEKLVAAEAKYGAVRDAEASGQSVTRARDNPTLAALEQQAIAIRADLKATARQFTAEYMNIDPRVRDQRARLADIEEQIATQKKSSQQGAVQEAREEVASARAAVAALRQQLSTNQGSVQSFTSRFNQYKTLQEQLTHLEQLHQRAIDRLAVLDAGERASKPKVEVVEAAAMPQSPSSPFYARDALLVVVGALVVGLLAMGVVELFNRPPQQPSTVVVPQTWSPLAMPGSAGFTALPANDAYDALPRPRHETDPVVALPAPAMQPMVPTSPTLPTLPHSPTLPRELDHAELGALLDACDAEFRAVAALFLSGLTPHEVVALTRGDIDRATGCAMVGGVAERAVPLPPDVLAWLPTSLEPAAAPLFTTASGRALSEAALGTALLYAAHDAALQAPDDVTPDALRHTYVAYLVRQGMRFGELAKRVGPLPAERLAAYRRLAADGSSSTAAELDPMLPALRGQG